MQEHLTFTFLPITFLLKRGSEGNINILTNPENPLYKTNIQLAVRVLKATEYWPKILILIYDTKQKYFTKFKYLYK